VRILFAITAGLAFGFGGRPASAGEDLPEQASDILFVGDSVTAGMYFFGHSNAYAEQGWAGQVMSSFGLPPDSPRLEDPYPLDLLRLTQDGLGLAGWQYPWDALPALVNRSSNFESGEPRSIVAVPGQTLSEVLRQSSENPGTASTGWVLGAHLLPEGSTAIETAEQSAVSPRWIVVFVGNNDALAHFGMVGDAIPPDPVEFAADYRELGARLEALLAAGVSPNRLLVVTLPDVTALPLLQPVPTTADWPTGTMTSAFLLRFRGDRFHPDEVWTRPELAAVRNRVSAYNDAIRTVAAERGYTVVDLETTLAELARDPAFALISSPYFSPDLHHPSASTHRRIATLVLDAMAGVAGVATPEIPEVGTLPTNADFSDDERARAETLMRLSLLGAEDGRFPPPPTLRGFAELGAGFGPARYGDASLALGFQVESIPGPITNGWMTRGALGLRVAAAISEGENLELPQEAQDVRAGISFEPVGRWYWQRAELGLRYGWAGGLTWYARGEWRTLFVESSGDPWAPARVDFGVRLGALWGRAGHNGN
jgi:hypothetical protein